MSTKSIEQILEVTAADLLSDAPIETGRTAILAVLAETPPARDTETAPKAKKIPKDKAAP
jgi:hypothetical protein